MKIYTEFRDALDRFLAAPEPSVLSVKGHWGVGKTECQQLLEACPKEAVA